MAAKVKVVAIQGGTTEERYENAIAYLRSIKMGDIASVAIESSTGTIAVLPRDRAERKLLGAYGGSGEKLNKIIQEVFKKYSKDTILQIDDKNYNTDVESRKDFRELAATIAEPMEEGKLTDELNTTPEPTEEDKLANEITADLEALGGEVAVDAGEAKVEVAVKEPKPEKTQPKEGKPKTPKEPKAAKEPKEPKVATPKHYETGLTNAGTAACRICGKSLSQEQSIHRGVGPVCWKGIQAALKLSDTDMETLKNPELTTDEAFAAKLAEARAILNAKNDLSEAPAGYVTLASVSKLCQANEIPISRWVKAFGGDRNINEPENEAFAPVYVGRTRWVPGNAFEVLASLVAAEAGKKKKESAGAAKAAKEAAEAKKKAAAEAKATADAAA